MDTHSSHPTHPPVFRSILRGIALRCPNCGQGRLFKSYLKQVDACSECGEPYARYRADDGPAWLTILLTGHIVVPLLVYMVKHDVMPYEIQITLMFGITTAIVFGMLPSSKGAFIAALWMIALRHKNRRKTA